MSGSYFQSLARDCSVRALAPKSRNLPVSTALKRTVHVLLTPMGGYALFPITARKNCVTCGSTKSARL
jgi:hypothetical protein